MRSEYFSRLTGAAVFCFSLFHTVSPDLSVRTAVVEAASHESAALSALKKGDFNRALNASGRGSKALQSFVEWKYLSDPKTYPDFERLVTFAYTHPGWPQQSKIREKAEKSAPNYPNKKKVLKFFDANPPRNLEGKLHYADLLRKAGRRKESDKIIREIWQTERFNAASAENGFFKKYKSRLTREDTDKRINFLLSGRYVKHAERLKPYLNRGEKRKLAVRAALLRLERDALRQYNALPRSLRRDPGVTRDLVFYHRKRNNDRKAVEILANLTAEQSKSHPEYWADHRLAMVRLALRDFGAKTAYKIVAPNYITKNAGDLVECEWTAGWLALRFLNKPEKAVKHFQKVTETSSMPVSIARGEYWTGRAFEASDKQPEAKIAYANAAKFPYVYYGQLATEKLGRRIYIPKTKVTRQERNAFNAARTVEATKIAFRNGYESEGEQLLFALAKSAGGAKEMFLVGDLAEKLKRPDLLVKLGKTGISRKNFAPEVAFPLFRSYYKGKARHTEVPFLMAVSRQESEFNPKVVSHAGARGLMQLMPATAKETARKLGLPYNLNRLLSDPYYNATLGSYYLEQQVERFNGSYIKALAAYNAGPGRVNRWTQSYGSPLDPKVDPIDWAETIPFSETRNYVQRIMESLNVYRARTNSPLAGTPMLKDLRRGR